MTGNPVTQRFAVGLKTSLPATIFSSNDVVGFLNSPGQGFWDGVLGGAYGVAEFLGAISASSVSVSNAMWKDAGGSAQLDFTLTTVSDPTTAGQVSSATELIMGVILLGVGAALLLIPGYGWSLDLVGLIFAAAGLLTIGLAFVTELAVFAPAINALGIGLAITVVAVAGLVVYSFASSAAGRAQVRAATAEAGRFTVSAAKKGYEAISPAISTGISRAKGALSKAS